MIRNAATFFLDNSPGIRKWEVEMDGRKGLRWNYEEKIPLPPLPPPPSSISFVVTLRESGENALSFPGAAAEGEI